MKKDLPLVISTASGKGGVGKTNISVNISCLLASFGKRVVLLDADLGLANVDVLLGLTPKLNLFHMFHEGASLADVLMETPYGFKILPAPSGISEMIALDPGQKLSLLEAMDDLEEKIDYLVVDTAAGISENVLYFNMAVQERLLIVTPDPTSITDAYAFIKVMQQNHDVQSFRVIVNMAPDKKTGKEIFSRLYKACDHFLSGISLDLVGVIPNDPGVRNAVINQKPFCLFDSMSPASQGLYSIVDGIQAWEAPSSLDGNIKFFWKRLLFPQ